jgi:hypothetical protein
VQTVEVILLAIIAFLLYRIKFGPRFLNGNSSDWLILEWHELGPDKITWKVDSPINIQFVPIIGWEYRHWGFKYGKPTPLTTPHYQLRSRLGMKGKYETLAYWVRDGAVCEISDELTDGDNFWENLYDHASAGATIKVHGKVPDCYQERVREVIAL